MNPQDIRAALKKSGFTAAKLAEELEITGAGVRQVMDGRNRSARIEARISEITDIPLYHLWPQWHEAPEGAPQDFDPTRLSVDLLEAVERNLAAELRQRMPGLEKPVLVRARHRAAVYNACLARGTIAIETGAGTAREAAHYLDTWTIDYEQATGEKPTTAALRKWALVPFSAPPSTPGVAISSSGSGARIAARDYHQVHDKDD